ncbi:Vesicle-associated membrane protein [Phytophthora megakarya]|uniref:Vesicle-associated membrane protein n=1 Tax=Phytophthora megakarya TaxID=4795 RepID=A0A225X3L2_9STRA|nr:Vesicle-associated membrane protein [Phytophthora megakarya]
MSIVYTLVARQQSVLCEHTDQSGNFPTVTRTVLKHLSQHEPSTSARASKSVFPYNEYNFFFLHDDGITYMCMAEERVHANVAFMMLAEMQTLFQAKYNQQAQTALAYAMASFNPTLDSLMKKYDNYKLETPMSQVRQKMERVKTLMIENVNQLMERGEKIELLVTRTTKLQQDAMKYEKSAKKLRNAFWWMNVKYWIYTALALAVLALVATFMICGTDLSSCASRVGHKAEAGIDKVASKAVGVAADAADKAAATTSGVATQTSTGITGGI